MPAPKEAGFRLEPPAPTMLGLAALEELADIAWVPDSRHLLIPSRFGDPAAGGLIDAAFLADGAVQVVKSKPQTPNRPSSPWCQRRCSVDRHED
jgi:hypothetical protein